MHTPSLQILLLNRKTFATHLSVVLFRCFFPSCCCSLSHQLSLLCILNARKHIYFPFSRHDGRKGDVIYKRGRVEEDTDQKAARFAFNQSWAKKSILNTVKKQTTGNGQVLTIAILSLKCQIWYVRVLCARESNYFPTCFITWWGGGTGIAVSVCPCVLAIFWTAQLL